MSYSRLNRREFVSRGRPAVAGSNGSAGCGVGITSAGGGNVVSGKLGPICAGSDSTDGDSSPPGIGSVSVATDSGAGLLLANRPGPVANGLSTTAGIRTFSSLLAPGFAMSAATWLVLSSSGDFAAGQRVAEGSKARLAPVSFGLGGVSAIR